MDKLRKHEAEIQEEVISILDKEKENFQIRFGSIHFDKNFEINIIIGAPPIFWLPIKPSVLKAIYFHNVFVLSLFNPTNLFFELKKNGIEFIKDDVTGKYFLGKRLEIGFLKFEYFNYFLLLIENLLHTEEAIISLINEVVSLTEAQNKSNKNIKMQPEIIHISTAYNLDNID